MKVFIASLSSVSPYSQSRNFAREHPRDDKESHEDYEERCWRYHCHSLPDGRVFIPPTQFKESLSFTARYLSVQKPGKGKQTFTKHFLAGLLVVDGPILSITRDDVPGEWVYVDANGQKGSSTRVWRCYPKIEEWTADVGFHVLDETITGEVLRYHVEQAGAFGGIGRFRPARGGFYG